MLTHETNPELSLLQALGDLSRADYEFKFTPAVRQTILDLSQKEEAEEILKLSPRYDDEARQVIFDHGDSLEVRIETRFLGDDIPEDVAMLLKRLVRAEDLATAHYHSGTH